MVFAPMLIGFVCRQSSDGSSDGAGEMMGESNIASPPPQTVATSGGAALDPPVQDRLVVAPQNFAGGPSGSPSEHVSFLLPVTGGAPEYLRVLMLFLTLCFGRSPQVLFLLLLPFPAAFCPRGQAAGGGTPDAGGETAAASRYSSAL